MVPRPDPRQPYFIRDLIMVIRGQDKVRVPIILGSALVSSDGVLWCEATVAVPFRFRTREYVGTVDEFMPPSSAKGWTSAIDLYVLAHNFVFWFLLLGWLVFVPEMRQLCRHYLGRRRSWLQQGLCGACGYDLRMSDGPRCPECGSEKAAILARPDRQRGGRPIIFGLRARAALGIAALNGVAAFCVTAIAVRISAPGAGAPIWAELLNYLPRASRWDAALTAGAFFVLAGNLVPAVWLLLGFRDAPGRPRAAQLAVDTAGALVVAAGVMPFTRAILPGAGAGATGLAAAWVSYVALQIIGAFLMEAGDRVFRSGK
jgi:hypothetical protein